MTATGPAAPARPERLLTFRSGGWVLLLAAFMCAVVATVLLIPVFRGSGRRAIGDGENVASYRFDLSNCLLPQEQIVAAGFSRDGVRTLSRPEVFTAAQADEFGQNLRRDRHIKYLVPGDRVIGVEIAGEARAYPVRVLNWHELVNDVLGGREIAVTYNPLCDSVVVFDRRIGGEVREFGISGLLHNSNPLYYDRQADVGGESLWSQLQMRAISGPAAGQALTVLPAALARWADWRQVHPQTTVLKPAMERVDVYRTNPYNSYDGSDELRFPVDPLPSRAQRPWKTPLLAIQTGGRWESFEVAELVKQAGATGVLARSSGGQTLTIRTSTEPPTAWVESTADGVLPPTAYSFWFAWHALREAPATAE